MEQPGWSLVNDLKPLDLSVETDERFALAVPHWQGYKRLRQLPTGPVSVRQLALAFGHHYAGLGLLNVLQKLEAHGLLCLKVRELRFRDRIGGTIRLNDLDAIDEELLQFVVDEDDNPFLTLERFYAKRYYKETGIQYNFTMRDLSVLKQLLKHVGGLDAAKSYVRQFFIMANRIGWPKIDIPSLQQHRGEVDAEVADIRREKRGIARARQRREEDAARAEKRAAEAAAYTPEQIAEMKAKIAAYDVQVPHPYMNRKRIVP